MSFWDTHDDDDNGGGGAFLTPEEKEELVKSQTTFPITGVRQNETQFGPRFFVDISLIDAVTGDEEPRCLVLAKDSGVESRDKRLQQMIDDHFGAGKKDSIPARLVKRGNAYLIKKPVETVE